MSKSKTQEYAFVCPHCKQITYLNRDSCNYTPCECGYNAFKFGRYTRTWIEGFEDRGILEERIDEFLYPSDIDTTSPDWNEPNVIDSIPYMKKERWEAKKGKDYMFWTGMFIQLPCFLIFLVLGIGGGFLPGLMMVGIIALIFYKILEAGAVEAERKRVHAINERNKHNKAMVKQWKELEYGMRDAYMADYDAPLTDFEKKELKIMNWESYKQNDPAFRTNRWRGEELKKIYTAVMNREERRQQYRDGMVPFSVYPDEKLDREINGRFKSRFTEQEILDYIMTHDMTYYVDLDIEAENGRI